MLPSVGLRRSDQMLEKGPPVEKEQDFVLASSRILLSLRAGQGGERSVDLSVRLRDGSWHAILQQRWPQGAPTAHQLELLQAGIEDEVQKLILTECGVQGVLLRQDLLG
jgi:hypothetical protein